MSATFHSSKTIPAALILMLAVVAAAPAEAGDEDRRSHHDSGHSISIDVGRGVRLAFGSWNHARRHHYDEYQSLERKLSERRATLLRKTRKAFERGNFDVALKRLTKLTRIDARLVEHRSEHRNHHHYSWRHNRRHH